MFYVYVLYRSSGVPCYVGKGKGKRVRHHAMMGDKHYNKHLARVIAKEGDSLRSEIVFETSDEREALAKEIELIALYGRANLKTGHLCNLTNGGDGMSGWIPSEETRLKISLANTGRICTEETRAKMSASGVGRPKTPEHRAKIGLSNIGKVMPTSAVEKQIARMALNKEERSEKTRQQHVNMTPEQKAERSRRISEAVTLAMQDPEVRKKVGRFWSGKTQSEEHREKNRQAQLRAHDRDPTLKMRTLGTGMLGKNHNDETKSKIGAANTGKIRTDEHRENMRQGQLGRSHSPETIEKMRLSAIARWVKKNAEKA